MDQVRLGRTGLTVSVAGLGCGGRSRLGMGRTHTAGTFTDAVQLIRAAVQLGVNYFDTAQGYGTETVVGQGIRGHRDSVVLATKISPVVSMHPGVSYINAATLRKRVTESLRNLGCDCIDVLFLHGVMPAEYAYCLDELVPELHRLQDRGYIRFLAISERFSKDLDHAMLRSAMADSCWDVILIGFNLLNPSAREVVIPAASAQDVGITIMYAVRDLLSQPDALRKAMTLAVDSGLVDADTIDLTDPLGFLIYDGGPASIVEAAYRFARHESGGHVVLTGTGRLDHLRDNVRAINQDRIRSAELDRIRAAFAGLRNFSGDSL